MRINDMPFVKEFIRTCTDGWKQGWHESNGGNLSYLLDKEESLQAKKAFKKKAAGEWQPLPEGVGARNLAGCFVLVSAKGSHFRDMASCMNESCGIIQISKDAMRYRKRWGFAGGGCPTSELASHIAILDQLQSAGVHPPHRVVYHCHPQNLIALTFMLPPDGKVFTSSLIDMISECKLAFPRGLGALGWMEPGSLELGLASAKLLEHNDAVVWARHGLICTHATFQGAFGLAHTIEKASAILVRVVAMSAAQHSVEDIVSQTLQSFEEKN